MPTADATILPPPRVYSDEHDTLDERGSTRRLDDVGIETVLEAMIVQRRQSSHNIRRASDDHAGDADDDTCSTGKLPAIDAFDTGELALLSDEALTEIDEDGAERPSPSDSDSGRGSRTSEVFLKAR